jgi:hypothetical protein
MLVYPYVTDWGHNQIYDHLRNIKMMLCLIKGAVLCLFIKSVERSVDFTAGGSAALWQTLVQHVPSQPVPDWIIFAGQEQTGQMTLCAAAMPFLHG